MPIERFRWTKSTFRFTKKDTFTYSWTNTPPQGPSTMGDYSGQPPPLFYYPLLFHLFSLVSDRFMIVLQKNVEKKSVPIRPCALGHFKVLQLWSNLQSFTDVLKVTIRGYTPMYDTSFFTIFWACCNGDGPAAGFCHPTPTPPTPHPPAT